MEEVIISCWSLHHQRVVIWCCFFRSLFQMIKTNSTWICNSHFLVNLSLMRWVFVMCEGFIPQLYELYSWWNKRNLAWSANYGTMWWVEKVQKKYVMPILPLIKWFCYFLFDDKLMWRECHLQLLKLLLQGKIPNQCFCHHTSPFLKVRLFLSSHLDFLCFNYLKVMKSNF